MARRKQQGLIMVNRPNVHMSSFSWGIPTYTIGNSSAGVRSRNVIDAMYNRAPQMQSGLVG